MLSKILSALLLICVFPILLIVAIVIIVDDGFPVLFRQKRVGEENTHFWIYKFRTMKKTVGDIPTHLVKDDLSIYTFSGPILRKCSLDELPQLFNILKGDMLFIGPRPALHNQDDLIALRNQIGVHILKPGVTGWAQVNGRDELNIPDKVKLDQFYLKNKSLWLDTKILIMTIFKVFRMEGVSK